jgi:hypothetical protein
MFELSVKEMEKEMVSISESIFGSIYNINLDLFRKGNDVEYEPTFNEIFDFHITSFGLGLMKNICTNNVLSPGTFLCMRSMIESIALKKMFACGDISREQEKMLKAQFAIIEWIAYEKYVEKDSSLFSPEMKRSYEESREKFLRYIGASELKRIERNQLLFLCENKKPIMIVEKYLPEFLERYKICSQIIHPNDNQLLYRMDFSYISYCFPMIEYLVNEYYNKSGKLINSTFKDVYGDCSGPQTDKMYDATMRFNEELSKISNVLRQFFGDNTYVANMLDTVRNLTIDLHCDSILGLTELMKSKFKIIVEMFAACRELIKDPHHILNMEKFYQLFVIHTENQFDYNRGGNPSAEYAYDLYIELYPTGFSREQFDVLFCKTTGFLITEVEPPSLTKLCRDFANCIEDTNPNGRLNLSELCILNYVESQMLSHSNGYIWYANKGSFNDIAGVDGFIKAFTIEYLSRMYELYRIHSIANGTKEYKRIMNILRNSIKRLKTVSDELNKLEQFPRIDISRI